MQHETLRQCICKTSFNIPQQLVVGNKTLMIPPNTRIIPNMTTLQTLPRYWGEDSLEWKPSCWIVSTPASTPFTAQIATLSYHKETLRTPTKGSYIAWSDGTRPCPGKKFSQVEFVAIMVSLFNGHRAEVVPEGGETEKEARQRCMRTVHDSEAVLLYQMKHPESVGLRWVAVN